MLNYAVPYVLYENFENVVSRLLVNKNIQNVKNVKNECSFWA